MTNQSASLRLAIPISPRQERERALSVASRGVTIEQHHPGLLPVTFRKMASTTAGYVIDSFSRSADYHKYISVNHYKTHIHVCKKILGKYYTTIVFIKCIKFVFNGKKHETIKHGDNIYLIY